MNNLRRVGWALIFVGTADVGLMIYCIANHVSYSSNFNILAIVAGVFLLRGSLKAARLVAWFSAFLLSGIGGMLVVAPFWMPWDYLRISLSLKHWLPVELAAVVLLVFPFLIWMYRTLAQAKSEPGLGAPTQSMSRWREPKLGFIAGALLAVVLGGLLGFMGKTETAQKVIANAKHQVGPNYRFFVSSMHANSTGTGTNVNTTVEAYNEREIKDVQVTFSE
jgi:hypothetical protein